MQTVSVADNKCVLSDSCAAQHCCTAEVADAEFMHPAQIGFEIIQKRVHANGALCCDEYEPEKKRNLGISRRAIRALCEEDIKHQS